MQLITHEILVLKAVAWLRSQGCGVVFRDTLRALTDNGERPDAIGWRDGLSILVECKISRADFLADKAKPFRQTPETGMGDWRFFLCPPDIIRVADLPERWGLLYVYPKQVKKIHGVPGNCGWWRNKPFDGNKCCEMQIMYSALRRVVNLGHIDQIYHD